MFAPICRFRETGPDAGAGAVAVAGAGAGSRPTSTHFRNESRRTIDTLQSPWFHSD